MGERRLGFFLVFFIFEWKTFEFSVDEMYSVSCMWMLISIKIFCKVILLNLIHVFEENESQRNINWKSSFIVCLV